jgi:hypothetical protein
MKESSQKLSKNSTTAEFILAPELITSCPKCGGEVGIWSRDEETVCIFCEYRMFDKEGTLH